MVKKEGVGERSDRGRGGKNRGDEREENEREEEIRNRYHLLLFTGLSPDMDPEHVRWFLQAIHDFSSSASSPQATV